MSLRNIYRTVFTLTPNRITLLGVLFLFFLNSTDRYLKKSTQFNANPDVAAKIDQLIRTGADGEIKNYPAGYLIEEFTKANANRNKSSRIEALDWKERGPGNVAGRTRCLLVDLADPTKRTFFLGTAGGGIWKSNNEGASWVNVTPDVPNLAVVTIAQSADDPSILYAGTGEGGLNGTSGNGSGILKSVDGGNSWTLIHSTTHSESNDFWNTNRIVVDPSDANVVIAATSNGRFGQAFRSAVMKSDDGGQTWTQIYSPNGRAHQIAADPQDFNTLYVSMVSEGIAKTTDGGQTWKLTSLVNTIGQASDRTEFAISPSNPNVMYASVAYRSRGGSGLYYSDDKGESWILVQDNTLATQPDFLIQGEYDNAIVVHPTRDDIVFWGGVEIWNATIKEGDIITGSRDFLGVDQEDTETFLSFVNFNNGTHFGNRIAIPEQKIPTAPTIEIRFGPGRSQKAHRFTVPAGSTSGVPAEDYTYVDYVDVPFEVWDMDNNRQLMVSFRDQENDGTFNLNESANDQEEANNREYVYIHEFEYDPDNPHASVTVAGGHEVEHILFIWPTLTPGGTWDGDNLPESIFRIRFGITTFQNATIINIASNGGVNGGKVHPDHQSFTTVTFSGGFKLFTCNDGGVNVSINNGGTFLRTDDGVNAAQFYHATKKPGENVYMGGTQDNEVLRSINADPDRNAEYIPQNAGTIADGFEVAWSRSNTDIALASNQQNVIFKTIDGGQRWLNAVDGLDDAGFSNTNAPFYTKIGHSLNADVYVFAVSSSGVWRSTDFAENWSLIDFTNESKWGGFLDVEVSDANPMVVWAGGGMSETRSLFVSTDFGKNFLEVSSYADRPALGNISTIVPDPNDGNSAYVTFSLVDQPKILKTTDLGQTWTDLTGFGADGNESTNGYPDVATFCVLPFPDGQQIWAGTEIGLFESTDAGATWHIADNGIPNVMIRDLKVVDGEVIAATHGRGIWTVDLGLQYTNQIVLSTEDEMTSKLQVYPNPTVDFLTLEFAQVKSMKINLVNTQGQVLMADKDYALSKKRTIDLRSFNPGIYILNVQVEGAASFARKVQVN